MTTPTLINLARCAKCGSKDVWVYPVWNDMKIGGLPDTYNQAKKHPLIQPDKA